LAWRAAASAWWLAAPALAFLYLVVRHDRVIRGRDAASALAAFYERGLSRIEDRWAGTGQTGERFRDERHPYANDLDLFGPASLALTGLTLLSLIAFLVAGLEVPLYFAVAAQAAFALPLARRVEKLLHAANGPTRHLSALADALAVLERERFTAPGLVALQDE